MIKKIYKLLILLQNLHKFLITIKNEKIIIKKKTFVKLKQCFSLKYAIFSI